MGSVILGLSASGRSIERDNCGLLLKGVTEELVTFILKNTGEPFEYISLSGQTIYGCQGCLLCAADNLCKVKDDWNTLRERVLNADALVFGAPIYYGFINAIGHAFLERFFSLRHRERFQLIGKPNVIVTSGKMEPNPAEEYIRRIFRSNYMAEPIGVLRAPGVAQCYTCGFGENCAAGAVVNKLGFLDEIQTYHIPRIPSQTFQEARIIAKRLGEIMRTNTPVSEE